MIIFEQEQKDGISDIISANAYIKYEHVAKMSDKSKQLEKSIARLSIKETVDLFPIESVMVSTGWNLNTDVFLPEPTWAARYTPKDKQFNYMHDENKIIGHMINSYAVGSNEERIPDDLDVPPTDFNIISEAVIYKVWRNVENQEWINQIIAEVEQGLWFVSMECLFSNFNYATISPEGQSSVIERNEKTAFLSKYLRSYGGDGEYQGYKIGRALDNFVFSGKGLVSKPANPTSIILKSKANFDLNQKEFNKDLFASGECNMSDDLKKQVDRLESELSKAKADNDNIKKEFEAKQKEEINSLIAKKDETIKEKTDAIAELDQKVEAYEKQVEELKQSLSAKDEEITKVNEELTKATESLETIKKEQIVASRVDLLVKAGFSQEEASEHVSIYESLNDEAFAKMADKFKEMKKEYKKEDKDGDDKEDKDKDKKKDKAKASDDTNPFDDVQPDGVVTETETDELQEVRQSVASWFSKSVGLETSK